MRLRRTDRDGHGDGAHPVEERRDGDPDEDHAQVPKGEPKLHDHEQRQGRRREAGTLTVSTTAGTGGLAERGQPSRRRRVGAERRRLHVRDGQDLGAAARRGLRRPQGRQSVPVREEEFDGDEHERGGGRREAEEQRADGHVDALAPSDDAADEHKGREQRDDRGQREHRQGAEVEPAVAQDALAQAQLVQPHAPAAQTAR